MRKSVLASCMTVFVLVLCLGCVGCGGGSAVSPPPTFFQADLSGDWGFHVLGANPPPPATPTGSAWGHGIFSMDTTGNGVVTTQAWSDNSFFNNIAFTLSGDGVMSVGGTSVHGFMSVDKNSVVAMYSNGVGGSSIWLLQRAGVPTFLQADLSGDWGFHVLSAYPAGNAWGHGIFSMDTTGNGVVTTQTWSDSSSFSNTAFTLSNDGVLSAGGTLHGFMSVDKNTVVATYTNGAGGSSLWLLQRRVGATMFLPADLSGNWGCHLLGFTSGGSAWGHGTYSISGTGVGVVTSESWSDPSAHFSDTTFSLSVDGVMSSPGGVHGFMSVDKNTMVATFTNASGGSSFWLLQRR